MMNKSKIDWCDFTWNPVTGCTRGCEYCYAAKQARRFCGDVRLNLTSPQIVDAGGRAYILEQPFKSDRETTIPFPRRLPAHLPPLPAIYAGGEAQGGHYLRVQHGRSVQS